MILIILRWTLEIFVGMTLIAWLCGMPLFIKGVIGEQEKEYK